MTQSGRQKVVKSKGKQRGRMGYSEWENVVHLGETGSSDERGEM